MASASCTSPPVAASTTLATTSADLFTLQLANQKYSNVAPYLRNRNHYYPPSPSVATAS